MPILPKTVKSLETTELRCGLVAIFFQLLKGPYFVTIKFELLGNKYFFVKTNFLVLLPSKCQKCREI